MADSSLSAAGTPHAVCGPDLEYDADFMALERSLEAAYVDRAVGPESEALEPDWKQIVEQALALHARSRDLRVTAMLTKAWLHTEGIPGLTRGLGLLHDLLAEHWDAVHPRLGAQGDATGLMRVTALRSLCDARSMLVALRAAPLVGAVGLSTLSLQDVEPSQAGKQSADAAADAAYVDAVFRGCKLDALEATYAAVNGARGHVSAIEERFAERQGVAALRLSELAASLQAIHACLAPRVVARVEQDARSAVEHALDRNQQSTRRASHGLPSAGVGLLAPTSSVELSRAEVVRALDQLCAYFEQQEPSSPVPLLLKRASRLTGMQFIDIIHELAPGAMPELAALRGPTNTEEP
jgi:type VI secretion system protein ImpA